MTGVTCFGWLDDHFVLEGINMQSENTLAFKLLLLVDNPPTQGLLECVPPLRHKLWPPSIGLMSYHHSQEDNEDAWVTTRHC